MVSNCRFPRRLNGSMPVARGRRPRVTRKTSMLSRGTSKTAEIRPTPSPARKRIPGACTTCWGMCGSGARMFGRMTIPRKLARRRPNGRPPPAWSGAARGSATRRACAQRPAPATSPRSGATTRASAVPSSGPGREQREPGERGGGCGAPGSPRPRERSGAEGRSRVRLPQQKTHSGADRPWRLVGGGAPRSAGTVKGPGSRLRSVRRGSRATALRHGHGFFFMLDFSRFSLSNMVKCGSALRSLGDRAGSMEEVAGRIVARLDDWFRVPETGEPACALVRLFKTHAYQHLPVELQTIAREQMAPASPDPETRCLTLLGTTGLLPEWRTRSRSKGHRVIPLPSVEV